MAFYSNQRRIGESEWMESVLGQVGGRRRIYVLVGPPAVGKSTWIRGAFAGSRPYVVSRDDIVDDVSSRMGMTYDDMFAAPGPDEGVGSENEKYGTVVKSPAFMTWQPLSYSNVLDANATINRLLGERVRGAVSSGSDIVVDMTNMTANARKQALKAVEGREADYEKVAVVFEFRGAEDVVKSISRRRSEEIRSSGGSKTIPAAVLDRMMSSFQEISPDEGFDRVVSVDNRDALRTSLG